MAYHIEEKKNIRIIGIRIPLVEDAEENMRNVPAFWKKAVLDGSISKLAELIKQKSRRHFRSQRL